MEQMPGVEFQISKSLGDLVESLPEEVFEVDVPRLRCKLQKRSELAASYVGHLKKYRENGSLDYDEVSREAERRRRQFGSADALKAASCLIENNPGDIVLCRDVAFSAIDWGLGGQAFRLLQRAAAARPYEPQTYQAMARCLTELGNRELATLYFEAALSGRWDERFGEFRKIVGVEYQRLLRQIIDDRKESTLRQFAQTRLKSLPSDDNLSGTDVVVTVMWNTDRTDVDLHVVEPTGETCSYENTETEIGGVITRDVTGGYGPEMYTLRKAPTGSYEVKINYFGSDANRSSTRTKVYLTIYKGFGTKDERVVTKTVQLSNESETRSVAKLKITD